MAPALDVPPRLRGNVSGPDHDVLHRVHVGPHQDGGDEHAGGSKRGLPAARPKPDQDRERDSGEPLVGECEQPVN